MLEPEEAFHVAEYTRGAKPALFASPLPFPSSLIPGTPRLRSHVPWEFKTQQLLKSEESRRLQSRSHFLCAKPNYASPCDPCPFNSRLYFCRLTAVPISTPSACHHSEGRFSTRENRSVNIRDSFGTHSVSFGSLTIYRVALFDISHVRIVASNATADCIYDNVSISSVCLLTFLGNISSLSFLSMQICHPWLAQLISISFFPQAGPQCVSAMGAIWRRARQTSFGSSYGNYFYFITSLIFAQGEDQGLFWLWERQRTRQL